MMKSGLKPSRRHSGSMENGLNDNGESDTKKFNRDHSHHSLRNIFKNKHKLLVEVKDLNCDEALTRSPSDSLEKKGASTKSLNPFLRLGLRSSENQGKKSLKGNGSSGHHDETLTWHGPPLKITSSAAESEISGVDNKKLGVSKTVSALSDSDIPKQTDRPKPSNSQSQWYIPCDNAKTNKPSDASFLALSTDIDPQEIG